MPYEQRKIIKMKNSIQYNLKWNYYVKPIWNGVGFIEEWNSYEVISSIYSWRSYLK